jgi:hypothetical protein
LMVIGTIPIYAVTIKTFKERLRQGSRVKLARINN